MKLSKNTYRLLRGLFTFIKTELGFTLVELLVVISIISILSLVGLVLYSNAQNKARDSVRKNDLNNLATALELYNQTNSIYVIGDISAINSNAEMQNYMNQVIPTDPKTGASYSYYSADGKTFLLCTKLENSSDPDRNGLCSGGDNYGVDPK